MMRLCRQGPCWVRRRSLRCCRGRAWVGRRGKPAWGGRELGRDEWGGWFVIVSVTPAPAEMLGKVKPFWSENRTSLIVRLSGEAGLLIISKATFAKSTFVLTNTPPWGRRYVNAAKIFPGVGTLETKAPHPLGQAFQLQPPVGPPP